MTTSGHAAARRAKDEVRRLLSGDAAVTGIGLAQRSGRWVVRVGLTGDDPAARGRVPAEVRGVPVAVEVVGPLDAGG